MHAVSSVIVWDYNYINKSMDVVKTSYTFEHTISSINTIQAMHAWFLAVKVSKNQGRSPGGEISWLGYQSMEKWAKIDV